MTHRTRRLQRLCLALVLVLAGALAAAPTATADPDPGEWFSWTRRVHVVSQKQIAPRICIEWRFTGRLVFTTRYYTQPVTVEWKDPRLRDPHVRIDAFNRCIRDYTQPRRKKRFHDARVGAAIGPTDETCDYDANLSAALPEGVQVGVSSPACGLARRFGGRLHPPSPIHSASHRIVGSAQRWRIQDKTTVVWEGGRYRPVCFAVRGLFTLWRSGNDSAHRTGEGRVQVCYNAYDAVP